MSVPTKTSQWVIEGKNGFDSLKYQKDTEIPKLDAKDVLVKIQGASLNYRDLIIPMGKYPFPVRDNVVPGSDGAGIVVAVGTDVSRFKPGDKVITLFNQRHIGGRLDPTINATGLGGAQHGTLRQYGAFNEEGLVSMPSNLDFREASTLTCAGLTAWNALFGLKAKELKPGDWVLTQGTGGVSLFAIQFAKAAGAKVIATTGSDSKADILKKLGADHILNYKTDPAWGKAVRELTPDKRGVDFVVEVAGPASMKQSLSCIRFEGCITIIGFLGGGKAEDQPSFLECLTQLATVRGVLVGPRTMMEEMCAAVEANPEKLKPVVDEKIFKLDQVKEAYEYMWGQGHVGKVCVDIE